jgi:hypothetical protein
LISLKVGESVLTDDQGIADSMNSYFSSVFTVENYDNIPVLDYIVDERLENIRCSVDEVGKLLLNLKVEKSPGPDNIPAHILKVCATELAPSISLLLNKSFSMGMLPIEWKTANITPIFKKGSKNSRENYRQISLTGIICKIGEKVVQSRVLDFWYRMNILCENQFAYLKGKSTVTQLVSTVDDWVRSRNSGMPTDVIFLDLAKAFKSTVTQLVSTVDDWVRCRNSGVPTDVIFLDLAKAFDSVPHERLILKLRSYGIEGSLLSWFRHFITGRKQRVVIRGTFLEWSPVSSGTPQGTILGPILFLIYINDITDCILSKV